MDGGLSMLLAGRGDGRFDAVPTLRSGISIAGDAASATLSDLDNDGSPDLTIAVNSEPVRSFRARLLGASWRCACPRPAGARATIDGQSAEVYCGSGYLSQSAPVLFFASPSRPTKISVRWPDGELSSQTIEVGAGVVRGVALSLGRGCGSSGLTSRTR